MRPNHKEILLQPNTVPGRLKKSRGRKRVRVQAKAIHASRLSGYLTKYRDWKLWYGKYLTVKDAQNAVTSLSQGFYKDTLMFRVHPDDLKGLEDARA